MRIATAWFQTCLLITLLVSAVHAVRAQDVEEAQYNVVANLYNAGQWEAALKKIAEREALPNLSDAMRSKYQYAKGLAYEKGGKTGDARKAYAALLEKYSSAAEAGKAALAVIYIDYTGKQFASVIQTYEKIDRNKLDQADQRNAAVMYAESLYASKKLDAALNAYQAAIGLGADRSAMAVKLLDIYYQTGQHQQLLDISGSGIAGAKADLVAMARAEALLALNKPADAEKEAQKVPSSSEFYPRTCFTLAQSLIRQGRLKDATAPLETAVRDMKNPPAGPAALVALAECLLASGRTNDAEKTLQQVTEKTAAVPEKERQDFLAEISMMRIRLASESGDPRRLARAMAETRANIPKEKLPEVTYMKIYGLAQVGDNAALLQGMSDDYALLRGTPREGPATLIYFAALKKSKRLDEGIKLIEEFTTRQPAGADAARARLEIANAALEKGDYVKAGTVFKDLLAGADVAKTLGAEVFNEALYNSAVCAVKRKENDEAIKFLNTLVQSNPAAPLLDKTLQLLGQVYSSKGDFKNAAEIWKRVLAGPKVENEGKMREELGKALFACADAAGARAQFESSARILGGDLKMGRDSRELWARALLDAGDAAGAAAKYGALYESYKDTPAYAYECAVSFERAKNWAESGKWYSTAAKNKQKLPPEYAGAVDACLAKAQLQAGTGDQGLPLWLSQLGASAPDATFEAAAATLARLTASPSAGGDTQARLEALLKEYQPTTARHYATGAVLLQYLAANSKNAELKQWGDKLGAGLTANEAALPKNTFGSTIAPAMINYFRGEAERLNGKFADALSYYETVLAAYPYNEWPDAAACMAADCYEALGDTATAVNKWNEVVKSAGNTPASAKWRELAEKRLKTVKKGE